MDDFEPPPRRVFLGAALAFTAVLGIGLAARPLTARADAAVDPLLDPDERKRLRRELRQAHRERMRQAREAQIVEASGGTLPPAGTTHPDAPPHHEYSTNRANHHGAVSRSREAMYPGMPFLRRSGSSLGDSSGRNALKGERRTPDRQWMGVAPLRLCCFATRPALYRRALMNA